jgi:hypothetical protein
MGLQQKVGKRYFCGSYCVTGILPVFFGRSASRPVSKVNERRIITDVRKHSLDLKTEK